MANEFKIRKGLIVEGASGGVVVNVLGSQGQLLSVTDDLSGSIFAVSDISGVPIFDVNSSGLSTFDGNVTFTKDVNITQTTDVGALNTTTLDDGSAVGLSLTYPTGNVAAGDGLAIAIGITGRGRSYIANSNTSNNLDASNLEFYTEGGGVINKVLTLDQNKDATFADNINVTNSASIGSTVAPTRTLDVRGSGMSIFGTGGYTELMIRGQVEGISTVRNVGSWHWSVRPDVGGDNDDLKLLRFVTGTFSGTAMQISNSTGNIGIGVNTIPNADYRLILEDTNEDILRLHNSTDGLDALISFTNPGGTLGRIQGIDNGGLGFDTGNNAGGINTNAMFIDNSGNVGINTTSPDFKLDVEGTLGVSDLPGNASSTSVLVQDQTTTPLAVVNGDFATDSDWSKGPGWTISGGKANVDGTQTATTYMNQSGILPNPPENIEYIIKYTISNYSAGAFQINVGGYISSSPAQAANGTYEVKVTPTNASSNTLVYIQANADAIGSIDTISVKQVTAGTNQIKTRQLSSDAFGPGNGPYLPLSAGSSFPLTGELHVDDRVIIENTTSLTTGVVDSLLIKTLSSGTSITNGFGGGLSFYLENTVYSVVNEVAKISVIETDTIAIDDKMVFSVKDNNTLAERLTLTGSEAVFTGNVGIGVTVPTEKLHLQSTTSGCFIRFADQTASGVYVGSRNNELEIYAGNSERMGIDATGVVRFNAYGTGILQTDTNGVISASLSPLVDGITFNNGASITNQINTDVDTGTETVASVAIATYTAAFFDFVIKKTTNVRSGTVYACHDGTNVEFTETSTQDLGDTSDVTLSVDISGGSMRLRATTTSDDWSVKSLIRAI
jgi:hypothetical protein